MLRNITLAHDFPILEGSLSRREVCGSANGLYYELLGIYTSILINCHLL